MQLLGPSSRTQVPQYNESPPSFSPFAVLNAQRSIIAFYDMGCRDLSWSDRTAHCLHHRLSFRGQDPTRDAFSAEEVVLANPLPFRILNRHVFLCQDFGIFEGWTFDERSVSVRQARNHCMYRRPRSCDFQATLEAYTRDACIGDACTWESYPRNAYTTDAYTRNVHSRNTDTHTRRS